MRPGHIPADLRRAGYGANRRGFSLSFALCLVLGPAIFLGILAYEGALADDPAPFDDDPLHHHRDIIENEPLRFCTYFDDENHIKVKIGPCDENSTGAIYHDHKVSLPKDFCVEKTSNGRFDIVNCSDSMNSPLAPRKLYVPDDLCLRKDPYGVIEIVPCLENEDSKVRRCTHIVPDRPRYTAPPGGWWEPCDNAETVKHLMDTSGNNAGFCLFLEPDGSSTMVHNSTCSITTYDGRVPEVCNDCDSFNSNGKLERFKCHVKAGGEDKEVERCPEDITHSKSDPQDVDEPWDHRNLCVIVRPDGSIVIVHCDNPGPIHIDERDTTNTPEGCCLHIGPDGEMRVVKCSKGSHGNEILPHDLEPLPSRLLNRALTPAHPNSPSIAESPENWTLTKDCMKNFCRWANSTLEIERRCYDGNPGTPPTPDQALKYTAPFECNLCLEEAKYGPDKEHIRRHCTRVMVRQDLVFKILVGVGGGIMLLTIIFGIYWEHRRKKNLMYMPGRKLRIPDPEYSRHRSRNCQKVGDLPCYDGTADLDISMFSVTASQRDAIEVHVDSPQSATSSRIPRILVIPDSHSLKSMEAQVINAKSDSHSSGSQEGPSDGVNPLAQLVKSNDRPKIPVIPSAQSLGSEEGSANCISSPEQSLVDERLQMRRKQQKRKDCGDRTLNDEASVHECNKPRCSKCKTRVRSSESGLVDDHPSCPTSSTRTPSERQLVLMPALTRSIDNV